MSKKKVLLRGVFINRDTNGEGDVYKRQENNLWQDFKAVTVIIDPSTGKLIDIENFNYYYDYAVGSNLSLIHI